MIRVKGEHKILDASVLFRKNDANQFSIEPCDDEMCVLVRFDYLDHNEGGVIQVLHTGKGSSDIEVCGTIKGAGKLERRKMPGLRRLLYPFSSLRARSSRRMFAALIFVMPVLAAAVILLTPETQQPQTISLSTKVIASLVIIALYWAPGFYIFRRRIPKGFKAFEEEF